MNSPRQLRAWVLAVALCFLAPAAFALPPGPPPPAQYSETKERLDTAAMEGLVVEPMALARGGDWPAAQQAFERQLAEHQRQFGADSIRVSDTLDAFVILNFIDGRQAEALGYVDRLREAVQRAWGRDSLEYALTLNDLAQMDFEHNKPAVSPAALADLREAYRIRKAQLGPGHKETISTLIYLGRLLGQRSVTRGDVRAAAPAIAALRQAITETEAHRAAGNNDNVWARAILAQTYARNGALDLAMREYRAQGARAELQGVSMAVYDVNFADALQEGGHAREALSVLDRLITSQAIPTDAATPNEDAKFGDSISSPRRFPFLAERPFPGR